jgi:myosin heavy subunit
MELSENITDISFSKHAQKLGVLATQLGYQGSLTVGALEDEIRFYQQRSVEAVMELGKRLLILKEMTPHGEFSKRIEMLGISKRTAQRFMSVVLKFSKTTSMSLLEKSGNGTKLLELMVLDDDDIEIIDAGGSIGDVNLDSIETMSVRELKKALREAREENQKLKDSDQAKDLILQKKDQKLNELDTKLTKLESPAEIAKREESEADQLEQKTLEMMQKATLTFLDAVSRFNTDMQTALESCQSVYISEQYEANIRMTYQSIATRCNESGLPIDFEQMVTPDWLKEAIQEDSTQTIHHGSED